MENMRTTVVFLSFIIISSIASGQGLTEKYTAFDIGLGRNSLTFDKRNISLAFTENSVRELAYDFSNDLDEKESYTNLYLGLKFGKYKGLSHALYFDIPVSGWGKGKFGYALGYNFALEVGIYDLLIRPSVGYSFGSTSYEIDEFGADTLGIIIDDEDVIGTDVSISVEGSESYLTPSLEVTFLVAQKFGVWVSVGYDYSFGDINHNINIRPDDDSYAEQEFNLDDPYINLKYGGETPTRSNIFDNKGVGITFGISSYWNRD